VEAEEVTLQLRQAAFCQQPSDVSVVVWSAAGGFGDPLEREPEKVCEDVTENRPISLSAAREIYAVVITPDGRVDAEATRVLRARRRAANRRTGDNLARLKGSPVACLAENLDLRREKDGLRAACTKCAADLSRLRDNYKDHCMANPNVGDRLYIDNRPMFRQFFCPGCGALIENEIALADDPVLCDIELHTRNASLR
jgi:N-methylhydantoinase B